ncbi:glycosyltransferase family 4 protein [Methanospirillum sp.]|uniref:glycosyltransferase family 4 protein n=1 Tax=Methanospirillum sp. TaxID=45200 RepID=UPI0035A0501D
MRLCIINHPNTSNITPLSNLIQILLGIGVNIHCIIGKNEYEHYKLNKELKFSIIQNNEWAIAIFRILNYFQMQLQVIAIIVHLRKNVDKFIFFIGGDTLLLPNLCAKVLRKKVILLLAGSSIKTHQKNEDRLTPCLVILRELCLLLADTVIVYSPTLIQDYELQSHRHKILIAHRHFLNFTTFSITSSFSERPPLIGYIGRMSSEKGIQHFVQSLPAIFKRREDLKAFIGGDGQLKDSIETFIKEAGLTNRIDFSGWIPHDNLPHYLIQLRLLVLPSYTEGLPNIMLEAMACGTPVLATPVGAVPDIIRDGKTGFIMENNTPDCIEKNVMRALNSPNLKEIAQMGQKFVEEEFRFEKVVKKWKEIIFDRE